MGVNEDWTRIELTVRHRRADKAAREIARGTNFKSLVVAYADFPEWREWKRVMESTPVKLPSQRTETNTERWLLEQCAPSLARVIHLDKEGDFFARFTEVVTEEMRQLSNTRQTVY